MPWLSLNIKYGAIPVRRAGQGLLETESMSSRPACLLPSLAIPMTRGAAETGSDDLRNYDSESPRKLN